MKLHQNLLWGAASMLLLTGCIDNNYDLSDIDTTTELKVKDLVLPVQIDPVYLSDIIKVKEGDRLTEITVNGNTFYGVEEYGDLNSDPVDIHGFTAAPDPMYDKEATFRLKTDVSRLKVRKAGEKDFSLYYIVAPVEESLDYEASNIDGSIRGLSRINFKDLLFEVTLSTSSLGSNIESTLENVSITLPQGLHLVSVNAGGKNYSVGNYSPSNGELFLNEVSFINNEASIKIVADGIVLDHYPNAFSYDETSNSGSFILDSDFNISDCQLKLEGNIEDLTNIQEVNYTVHYDVDALEATSILGSIQYRLDGNGLNIDPINLENIPSFLDSSETNLILSNPQLYLNLKNPIGQYGLSYQSGLSILASRPGEQDKVFYGPTVKVPGMEGDYNFVLCPYTDKLNNIPSEYAANINKLEYENLGYLLSGAGLPKKLDIDLISPMIPLQKLENPLMLNQDIEGLEGNYRFIAPLALGEGSQIVKTVDGWYSDDLADLVINTLALNTIASNDLPMDVIITVYPIDKNGHPIESASVGSVKLPAMAQNENVEFVMEGTITDLDGVEIYVMAATTDDGEPLAPSQHISLENIKAKVTGSYIRKL